jgi:DNA repair photolyase
MTTYREYATKAILKKKSFTDSWFLCSNGGSPYRGCEHACVYCDGRSERYGLPLFDEEIQVKANAPEVLEKELSRMVPTQRTLLDYSHEKRVTSIFYGGSGTSDWYQPAERKYNCARRMVEKYVKYGIPLHIMTKSDLVLRDLDLLKRLPWCTISFSLSTSDDSIAHLFEPKASIPSKRFEAMRILSGEGISCGACYMPIIPFLCDSEEMIDTTIRHVKESGGTYALPGVMTLRRDREEFFFRFIDIHFPHLTEKFRELYACGYTPKGEYIGRLNRIVLERCRRYGITPYIPRYIPEVPSRKNMEISTILHRISFMFDIVEGPSKKSRAFTRAANSIDAHGKDIEMIFKKGRLHDIPGVGHTIGNVIGEILLERKSSLLESLNVQ